MKIMWSVWGPAFYPSSTQIDKDACNIHRIKAPWTFSKSQLSNTRVSTHFTCTQRKNNTKAAFPVFCRPTFEMFGFSFDDKTTVKYCNIAKYRCISPSPSGLFHNYIYSIHSFILIIDCSATVGTQNKALHFFLNWMTEIHTRHVTLKIFGTPIENQWGSQEYPG